MSSSASTDVDGGVKLIKHQISLADGVEDSRQYSPPLTDTSLSTELKQLFSRGNK